MGVNSKYFHNDVLNVVHIKKFYVILYGDLTNRNNFSNEFCQKQTI